MLGAPSARWPPAVHEGSSAMMKLGKVSEQTKGTKVVFPAEITGAPQLPV